MLKIRTLRKSIHKSKPAKVRAIRYLKRNNLLVVAAEAKSSSTDKIYQVRVALDVEVYNAYNKEDNCVKFKLDTGKRGYVEEEALYDIDTLQGKVRCTCAEFKFTYAYQDNEKGSLYGSMFKLPKPKGKRGPRNPKHKPGSCKHIQGLINYIEKTYGVQWEN